MHVDRDNRTTVVTHFPSKVREIEHVWIPMSDGVCLSARLWLPEDAEAHPVPAIFEYIPYRKRDGTRAWDDPRHHYWAGHGYACIRLDIRGTGESQGVITDEYTRQEHDDALEAISWMASQPWCNGKVGMTGISWGGFNALQVAARRPPALKAIITHCSTDDRYRDDMHYMGGCLLVENFFWGSSFFHYMARPPDPVIQGENWRELWRTRLENWEPVCATVWLEHQRRDDYWKYGSVCENYDDIECAVYAVGGWEDAYSNTVPRLLENLSCPRKGLVGPWGHKYPSDGLPGPSIGWLQDALRWWDHWLKDLDTGVMDEPMYRVWMREPSKPAAVVAQSTGYWVSEARWPSQQITNETFVLLSTHDASLTTKPCNTVGLTAGVWCPFGLGGASPDLALDQNEDDVRSVTMQTDPLDTRHEILGAPLVHLSLSVDQPDAFIAVRLVDVAPDGTASRVSYQLLNLRHRHDSEHLSDITPGESMDIIVRLNDVAWLFEPGHRLRLSLSTSYWPLVWPSPRPVTLTVSQCRLELPRRTGGERDVCPFEAPEVAPLPAMTEITAAVGTRTLTRDLATGEWVTDVVEDGGVYRLDDLDLEVADGTRAQYRITEGDPNSASAKWVLHSHRRRDGWDISLDTTMQVRSTPHSFIVETCIEAFDGQQSFYQRRWRHTVRRDGL